MDFARVIALVAGFLDAHGIRWALCGGLGLAGYGLARTTFDVDLVVDGAEADAVVAFMEAAGYETLHRSAGFSNHLHPETSLGRVDFVYLRGETREKLFAGTREVAGPANRPVHVPKPEHLAAMKIAALASDPARLFQDLADLRFLLGLPGVDRDEVREYFVRHGLERRFDEIIETL